MSDRTGFTLMEVMVVMIIIGIGVVFFLPNYTAPMEQAKASAAKTNLLALYSAEQNYNNNNGGSNSYCIDTTNPKPCDTLADINTALTLNIQDDGSYSYICQNVGATYTCTATRNGRAVNNALVVTLTSVVQMGGVNPTCSLPANWCPS